MTISSPGRSPKQPLPGTRLHDPLHAHARKRHVSTIRDVSGSRVNVFVVLGRCDVRSIDPWVCFRVGHVSMLSFYHDGGERGTCSGVRAGRPFRFVFVYVFILLLLSWISTVAYLDGSLRYRPPLYSR